MVASRTAIPPSTIQKPLMSSSQGKVPRSFPRCSRNSVSGSTTTLNAVSTRSTSFTRCDNTDSAFAGGAG